MTFESSLGMMNPARLRAAGELARVRRHIAGAERMARGREVALGRLQTLNRLLLLEELTLYRRGGQFPVNRESRRTPVPVFVDEHGTRCAVGHLMEVSGHGALVQHIARTRNDARVRELAALPEVRVRRRWPRSSYRSCRRRAEDGARG